MSIQQEFEFIQEVKDHFSNAQKKLDYETHISNIQLFEHEMHHHQAGLSTEQQMNIAPGLIPSPSRLFAHPIHTIHPEVGEFDPLYEAGYSNEQHFAQQPTNQGTNYYSNYERMSIGSRTIHHSQDRIQKQAVLGDRSNKILEFKSRYSKIKSKHKSDRKKKKTGKRVKRAGSRTSRSSRTPKIVKPPTNKTSRGRKDYVSQYKQMISQKVIPKTEEVEEGMELRISSNKKPKIVPKSSKKMIKFTPGILKKGKKIVRIKPEPPQELKECQKLETNVQNMKKCQVLRSTPKKRVQYQDVQSSSQKEEIRAQLSALKSKIRDLDRDLSHEMKNRSIKRKISSSKLATLPQQMESQKTLQKQFSPPPVDQKLEETLGNNPHDESFKLMIQPTRLTPQTSPSSKYQKQDVVSPPGNNKFTNNESILKPLVTLAYHAESPPPKGNILSPLNQNRSSYTSPPQVLHNLSFKNSRASPESPDYATRPSPYTSHRKLVYSGVKQKEEIAQKITPVQPTILKIKKDSSNQLDQSFNGFMAQRKKLLARLTSNLPN